MTLVTISALEVRFVQPFDEVLIADLETILDVLKIQSGCLGYSVSSVQHVPDSVFITGYWRDAECMHDHFSSTSLAALFDVLMPHIFSVKLSTFFMRSHVEDK